MTKTLVYLATPYSDDDPAIRRHRFEQVNEAAAVLMRAGLHVFSPISHTHPIAEAGGLPLGWDYWEGYDRAILQACAVLVVLMLPGWEKSLGVSGECRISNELGIPVLRFYPTGIGEPQVKALKAFIKMRNLGEVAPDAEADDVADEAARIETESKKLRDAAERIGT